MYDRKLLEKIESWIQTCCLEQRRHKDYFEVQQEHRCSNVQIINDKKNSKSRRYVSTYRMAPPPNPEDLGSRPVELCPVTH